MATYRLSAVRSFSADELLKQFVTQNNLPLVSNSSIPLYHQLYRILQRFIKMQRLRQGDRFPSEEAIAACFEVSRPTVNKAVQQLVDQGWLVRDRGRGTFVKREPLVDLALLSQNLSLTEQFPPDAGLHTEIVRREIIKADAQPEIAETLRLSPRDKLLFIRRLRCVSDRPVMVCDAYLPADRFPDLGLSPFVRGSLYATLQEKYGCIIDRSERRVEASEVTEVDVAKLLGISPFSPILLLTGITFLEKESTPIEYMVAFVKEGVAFKSLVRRSSEDRGKAPLP